MAEFDIGVLMGSQSPTVFDEYCAMHQGCRRLRQLWEKRCECKDPNCFRGGLQEIAWMVHDDADLMLAFLERCKGFEPMIFEEFDAALLKLYDDSAEKHGHTRVRGL